MRNERKNDRDPPSALPHCRCGGFDRRHSRHSLPAPTTVQRVVSPGGIEAWLVHEPSLPLVALNFAFVGGATEDPTDKPGVGYMVSSLLDDGAGELDAKAFQQRLEENAVELRFSVTQDYFYGSIRLLKDRQEQSFDLLRLALNQPRFDADAIGRVREQILSGLRRETTDPGSIANRTWSATAFPNHPYGRPTGGTLTSIPTITADDLRTFSRQVLTRDTLKVAAVGDIDAATLGQTLDRVFGTLPATGTRVAVPDVPVRDGGKRIVTQLAVPQAVVRMGGAGVMRKDPDFIPAYIVNHILGGGSFTSRLYDEVREKRGLAYGVYSYLHDDAPRRHVHGEHADPGRQHPRSAGADRGADPAHGEGRSDRRRTRQGQGLSQGLLCAQLRHLDQDRRRPVAEPARRTRHRLHRKAQRA